MRVIKYFMKLHPEYNEPLMDFYAKLYDKCPIDVDDELELSPGFRKEINKMNHGVRENSFELEQMIWDLGLSLPSWDDELPPYGDRSNNETPS